MRRDDWVDFHAVPDGQLAIHQALENWSRWVRVRPHGWQVSPMFRLYRPANPTEGWWDRRDPKPMTNVPDAVEMEKAVSALPVKHRDAARWSYVFPGNPAAMARRLGVNLEGLRDLVIDARSMLKNRNFPDRR